MSADNLMSDAVMVPRDVLDAVEFRVALPWRKAGCEGWRIRDAQKRIRLGEYDAVEVRFTDGSVSVITAQNATPTPQPADGCSSNEGAA